MNQPIYEYPDEYQPPTQYAPVPPSRKRVSLPTVVVIAGLVVFAILTVTGLLILTSRDSHAQQIQTWREEAAPDFLALAETMEGIANAADNEDFPGVTSLCVIMQGDVEDVQQHLPSPDVELTHQIEEGMEDYEKAASLCENMDTYADVNVVGELIRSGNAHLEEALEIVKDAEKDLEEEK